MSRKLDWKKNNLNKLVAISIVRERRDETVEDIIYEKEFAEMLKRNKYLEKLSPSEIEALYPGSTGSPFVQGNKVSPDQLVVCIHCGDVYKYSEMRVKFHRVYDTHPTWGCKHSDCDGHLYGMDIHNYVEPTAEEIEKEKNWIRTQREKRAYQKSGRAERDKQNKKIIEEREEYAKKIQKLAKENVELSNRQRISKVRQELTKDLPEVELPKYNKTKTIEVVRLPTRRSRKTANTE